MRVTALILPLGVVSASLALFRGPPAEVQFGQEAARHDADSVELEAAQQWSRAAEATALGNAALRSASAVALSCWSARLEVVLTEQISCANPHDHANCARARAAEAEGRQVCADQLRDYGAAAAGLAQLNAAVGRQLGAQLFASARDRLAAEGTDLVERNDPVTEGKLFPADTTADACRQATELARGWPMLKAPFPAKVQSRAPGFADAVLAQVAAKACGLEDVPRPQLRQVPGLEEGARRECHELEQQMRCQVAYAEGLTEGCSGADEPSGLPRRATEGAPLALSSAVARYATCTTRQGYRRCTFDQKACVDDAVESRSEAFLSEQLPKAALGVLGGSTGAERSSQRSCTTVSRPVNPVTQRVFGGLRRFASFGRASDSDLLASPHVSISCAEWYARDGQGGSCQGLPHDQLAFHPECWTGFAPVRGR